MPRRVILANQADASRFAMFAATSGWLFEGSAMATVTTPELARWRTPGGLGVTLFQDPLIQRPMVEFDPAASVYAIAEADELERLLPRVFEVIRFADARQAMTNAWSSADRGLMLPVLAATAIGQAAADLAEVTGLVAAALTAVDVRLRAGAILAATYLGHASSDGLRRITFLTERISYHFVPFAAGQGWVMAGHRPPTADQSESWTWQAETGVTVTLIADLRLSRELVTLVTDDTGEHHVLDRIEHLIHDRFDTVDLDQALDLLIAMPDKPARMDLLKAVVACAPGSYRPRFLAVMAELFGSPVTPLRGFAVGATIYFPWPQVRPFLDWMAAHDPEATIRGVSKVGIAAVRDVCGDSADLLTPGVTYYIEDADGRAEADVQTSLLRRVHVLPASIDQRLGDDLLWRRTVLPAGFPAGYDEISFQTAGQIADAMAAGRTRADG